jgi:hypothetical protein
MSILDSFHLDNKVAIVTAGAGLSGRQIARAPAEAFANLAVDGGCAAK